MIRLIQRRLIIPRGDTGTFSIPVLAGKNSGDASIFTIFNPLTHRKIFEKAMEISDGVLTLNFTHGDTVNLPVGEYMWDIKFYADPETIMVDGVEHVVGGTEVDSYYAAFQLPVCEIRETGDNLLMADDTPSSALAPTQLNYIEGSKAEIQASKEDAAASATSAASSASEAGSSAANAGQFAVSALDSKNAAEAAAAEAASAVEQMETALAAKANTADLANVAFSGDYNDLSSTPTNVSTFTNDAGYLTEHQDISGKANITDLANVATSGSYNDLQDTPTIPDVQINGSSIIENGIANIPVATTLKIGLVRPGNGIGLDTTNGDIWITGASDSQIKGGTGAYAPITAKLQHKSVFYGLAKAAGDNTQSASSNAVGTYTDGAKTAIQNMLDVPSNATMTTAISNAIGNINSFDMSIVQELPSQDISTHTIYLIPKTGDTNDVYDEYVYINNAWEMIGNTQIDLSNYVQKTDYATSENAGLIRVSGDYGLANVSKQDTNTGETIIYTAVMEATKANIKEGTDRYRIISSRRIPNAVFYGLAKAAGDTTQSQSDNEVGTYTTEAKAAIQTMLGVPSTSELSVYATKTDTVLDTTLSRGRKDNTTVGGASLAFGVNAEASGYYSVALGLNTTASSQGAYAEGKGTVAHYIAHAEGEDSQALGSWSHAQNLNTIANGGASSASGRHTIANGADSFVIGKYNAEDSYDNWPTWTANTSYEVGDRVKRNLMVQNELTDVGYHCTVANNDATFDNAHWELDGYHMNYVEIVGNGKEYEDPETHQTVRAGSNAYALTWTGDGKYAGDVYVGCNADSTGGVKLASINDVPIEYGTEVGSVKTKSFEYNNLIYTTSATGYGSYAEGGFTSSSGVCSHAEGQNTSSSSLGSHAEGGNATTASGNYAHAEGSGTTASKPGAHSEGMNTQASGNYSHAEGRSSVASGANSHAEGFTSTASGNSAHAEGRNTISSGKCSHAEGENTTAVAANSHVVGTYNVVDSYDSWNEWAANTSYVVGNKVKRTTVANDTTTVIGYICISANNDAEFDSSKWSVDSTLNYVEIVGNGKSTAYSNARTLDWSGNERLKGNLYVGCNADSTGGTMVPYDVQINGNSIVSNGIATIPFANSTTYGIVKTNSNRGIGLNASTELYVIGASEDNCKAATEQYRPITPWKQHVSIFYGLATAAGDTTQKSSSNSVGTYTNAAKDAIQNMLGISDLISTRESATATAAHAPFSLFLLDGKLVKSTTQISVGDAVAIGTNCQVVKADEVFVKYTDYATSNVAGVVKVSSSNGITINGEGTITPQVAIESDIKTGTTTTKLQIPANQHIAAFYGLAKAAGEDMKNSSNAVGTYTAAAATAIKTMLQVQEGLEVVRLV